MTDTTDTAQTADPAGPAGTADDADDGRTRVERYRPTEIEPRWQARWDELEHVRRPTSRTRAGPSSTC